MVRLMMLNWHRSNLSPLGPFPVPTPGMCLRGSKPILKFSSLTRWSCSDTTPQLHSVHEISNPPSVVSNTISGPHRGPIHGTKVDTIDGEIDIADFECPQMADYDPTISHVFNSSKTSIFSTISGKQNPGRPEFPSREEGVEHVTGFVNIVLPYFGALHGPSLIELVCV